MSSNAPEKGPVSPSACKPSVQVMPAADEEIMGDDDDDGEAGVDQEEPREGDGQAREELAEGEYAYLAKERARNMAYNFFIKMFNSRPKN